MIRAIIACDDDRGIGKQNTIPWDNREDMKWFKDHTLNQTVIMGSNTWRSLKKPLPNRKNIVVSSKKIDDVETISGDICEYLRQRHLFDDDPWIIGGVNILIQSLPYIDLIYLTRIPGRYNCDLFLPEFPDFELITELEGDTCTFQILEKRL